jgi:hypothetical protein
MGTKLILTDVLFTLEDVRLGSLIPNIRNPHQDALAPITAIQGKDYTVRTQKNFKTLLSSEHKSSFTTYFTKLLSIEHDSASKEHLELSSKEGMIYEMNQPKKWFKDLCKLKEVQDWLQEGIDDGQDTFMIIGYRTLKDAKLEQRGEAASQTKFQADVPIGEAISAAASGGVANVGLKGNHASREEHEDTAEMEGERIYALCYRRVKHSWHEQKSVNNAFLQSRNIWRTFSDTRTDDDDDGKFLEVDIEDYDEEFLDGPPESRPLLMEMGNEVYILGLQ